MKVHLKSIFGTLDLDNGNAVMSLQGTSSMGHRSLVTPQI